MAGQDSERTRRKATYLEHGGEPDDEAPVHLHLLLLVAVHHSGGHDLVKVPGGVADDGGDVADDDADEGHAEVICKSARGRRRWRRLSQTAIDK